MCMCVCVCVCLSFHTDGILCMLHEDHHLMISGMWLLFAIGSMKKLHGVSTVQFFSFKADAVCS